MAEAVCQIITRRAADLPRDFIVNTVHFSRGAAWSLLLDNNPDLNTLATDVRNLFRDSRQYVPENYGVEVKVYDLGDDQPRQPKGKAAWALYSQGANPSGPREVALCLSFRGASNVPRQRGRIFLGPWTQGVCVERPAAGLRANLTALAQGLANIGGVDIDWAVRSQFPVQPGDHGGTMYSVQQAWADDEWDTIRSRGLKSTARTTLALSE